MQNLNKCDALPCTASVVKILYKLEFLKFSYVVFRLGAKIVIILMTRRHYMPWFLGVIAKFLQATKKQLTWKENHILKAFPWTVHLSYHCFWLPICKYACRGNNFLLIFILTKIETWCNNVGKVRILIVGMRKARILHTV